MARQIITGSTGPVIQQLEHRIAVLERQVAVLTEAVRTLTAAQQDASRDHPEAVARSS